MHPYRRTEIDRTCQCYGINPSGCEVELKYNSDFRICNSCSRFMKEEKTVTINSDAKRIIFLNQRRTPRSRIFQRLINRALNVTATRVASIITCSNRASLETIFICVFGDGMDAEVDMQKLQEVVNKAGTTRLKTIVPPTFSSVTFSRSKDKQNRGNWVVNLDGVEYFSGSRHIPRLGRTAQRNSEDDAVAALLSCAVAPSVQIGDKCVPVFLTQPPTVRPPQSLLSYQPFCFVTSYAFQNNKI